MVDAHIRRAPNAKIDLISAKVKCVQNKSVEWLCTIASGEQRKVIRSAVKQRRGVAQQLKQRKIRNIKILKQRLYELVLKKETKKTKQMEKKVAKFIAQGEKVTMESIASEFPEATPEAVQFAVQVCHDPESITGKECTHLWTDKVKCQMEVYTGNVFEYLGGKKKMFTVEYWFPESPEDSHMSELTATEIVSDILLGDLLFH